MPLCCSAAFCHALLAADFLIAPNTGLKSQGPEESTHKVPESLAQHPGLIGSQPRSSKTATTAESGPQTRFHLSLLPRKLSKTSSHRGTSEACCRRESARHVRSHSLTCSARMLTQGSTSTPARSRVVVAHCPLLVSPTLATVSARSCASLAGERPKTGCP